MPIDLEEQLERAGRDLAPTQRTTEEARERALAALAGRAEAPRHSFRRSRRVERRSRRRLGLAGFAGAAAAAAAVLFVVTPWQGSGPLATERALAAIGDRPVIHAVVERTRPESTIVDLASGATRAEILRSEYWYDEERSLLRVRMTIDGHVLTELLQTREGGISDIGPVPRRPVEPRLDPALGGFASRYREALETGTARVVGETKVDGADAILLEFRLPQPPTRRPRSPRRWLSTRRATGRFASASTRASRRATGGASS